MFSYLHKTPISISAKTIIIHGLCHHDLRISIITIVKRRILPSWRIQQRLMISVQGKHCTINHLVHNPHASWTSCSLYLSSWPNSIYQSSYCSTRNPSIMKHSAETVMIFVGRASHNQSSCTDIYLDLASFLATYLSK